MLSDSLLLSLPLSEAVLTSSVEALKRYHCHCKHSLRLSRDMPDDTVSLSPTSSETSVESKLVLPEDTSATREDRIDCYTHCQL